MSKQSIGSRSLTRRDFLRHSAIAGAGLTVLPSLLAACAAPAAPGAAPQAGGAAAPAGEPVKVTWFVRDDAIVNPWEDKMVAEFNAANPGIVVEWISGGQGPEREAKFGAMVAAGTPPDVFASWQEAGFGDYAARNLMLDLKPYVDADTSLDLSSIPKTLMDTFMREGKLYGIPFASGASYLFYNKNAFDEAGLPYPTTNWDDPTWTWDAWVDVAKKLTKNYGQPDAMYGGNAGFWPSNAINWLFDSDLYPKEAYETGFFTESPADSENSVLAFQSQADLAWVDQVAPTPALNDAMTAVGDPFKTGRIAMNLNGVWGFWVYSDITAFEVGAAAFPVGKVTNKPVIFTDPWMIARESKNPDAAWKFTSMLVNPKEGAKSYMETTTVVPPAAELLPEWYDIIGKRMPWLAGAPLKQLIEGSLAKGFESANHLLVSFNQMESMVSNERQAIFLNKSPASEVMPTIKTKLEEIAAEARKNYQKS
ncbi:MAG: extracellular solute-binding protein [Caldilineaceae bacterium]